MASDRTRFDLSAYPLPKNAQGKTFFDKSPGYLRIKRAFRQLVDDPGLGVLTAEAGVGKTAAFRNLCAELPRPDHLVLYLCDTSVSPLDLYRTLAEQLGVRPSHRRGQRWADIKKVLVHMVDERATIPLVILDEAHHLSDGFLLDLGGVRASSTRPPSRRRSTSSEPARDTRSGRQGPWDIDDAA